MPRNSGLPPAAEISRVRDRDATVVVPMLFLPLLSEPSGYYPALGGVCRGSFAQDRSKNRRKHCSGHLLWHPPSPAGASSSRNLIATGNHVHATIASFPVAQP